MLCQIAKILKMAIKYTLDLKSQDKRHYVTEMSVRFKMEGELMSQHIKEIAGNGMSTEC